ncbi:MAG: bifunctional 4-hydroxy-2-oxoglutarate aldolase/2-dehydro-3-deoxy-phosphogluconate aldolase [Eubacteriales bacterium]|nr:bifunctional 4-hydroxy-2-oxoglutarate aldolase/2-dehydro-3-deoxy-phosphogluconate aldolase [Eubacteriales bacterium]
MKEHVMQALADSGIVPVVVLEDAKDAVPTAQALLAGGIGVMEITFRTAAAEDSIRAVAENCPEMIVGAGTVITIDQCIAAVSAGAKFIVAPGFRAEVVEWCVEHNVPITPGCVTPTEIMMAMEHGLQVVKFFPANIYGGLKGMKNLAAPFGSMKFIPTGGVNTENVAEYAAAPFVFAVGGSWVCPKAEIAAGNFEAITQLSLAARANYLAGKK